MRLVNKEILVQIDLAEVEFKQLGLVSAPVLFKFTELIWIHVFLDVRVRVENQVSSNLKL